MASSVGPLEDFLCPVCLETLSDPATIPCGHTYCLQCIKNHWDKSSAKGSFSCPQCRQVFSSRPLLGKNTLLIEAMRKLNVREQNESSSGLTSLDHAQPAPDKSDGSSGANEGASNLMGLYPQLPSALPNLCPLHQQVLEFYCCDDKESVCDECSFKEHKGHRLVRPDEEKEELVKEKKAMIQRSIQEREQIIQTLPQAFQTHKNFIQGLQQKNLDIFNDIMRSVELMKSQTMDLIQAYESSIYNRFESHRFKMQKEIGQLWKQDEELDKLANTENSIQCLKMFDLVSNMGPAENAQLDISQSESLESGISSVLGDFRDRLHEFSKESLARMFRIVNEAKETENRNIQVAEASQVAGTSHQKSSGIKSAFSHDDKPKVQALPTATTKRSTASSANLETKSASHSGKNPAPKTREEMLKFRFEPTLDPNSAFRHIRLSDGDRKATLRAEKQNYPEHEERFLYWRQVMCKEPLAGSPYYWEVEWTGQKVTIGVAYKDMGRSAADDSARLGHNPNSWSLYWTGTAFCLWHAGKETVIDAPKSRRIGVYLDQQAGVLAFYRIVHNQAHQICCVETEFSGALYPGFRFWSGVGCTITICQLD